MILCVALPGPQGVLVFSQTLLWGCLWGCVWMGLTMESVHWVKISLPNVGGPSLTSWRPGQDKKAGPPAGKRELLGQRERWSFLAFRPELTHQLFLCLEPAGFWTETYTIPWTLPVLWPVDVDWNCTSRPPGCPACRWEDCGLLRLHSHVGLGAQCFTVTAREFWDSNNIERVESESAS